MNANKAAGPDGLQSKLIKSCAKGLANVLKPVISLVNGNLGMLFLYSKRAVRAQLKITARFP